MVISENVKSVVYIVLGALCIIFFSSKLLLELLFLLLGLYLINRGLALRGMSASSFFMRMWMGSLR